MRQLVTRYLVKWKGYGGEEATWERETGLRLHAQESIDEYEYRQAEMRGETTVGVHYIHTLKAVDNGALFPADNGKYPVNIRDVLSVGIYTSGWPVQCHCRVGLWASNHRRGA